MGGFSVVLRFFYYLRHMSVITDNHNVGDFLISQELQADADYVDINSVFYFIGFNRSFWASYNFKPKIGYFRQSVKHIGINEDKGEINISDFKKFIAEFFEIKDFAFHYRLSGYVLVVD